MLRLIQQLFRFLGPVFPTLMGSWALRLFSTVFSGKEQPRATRLLDRAEQTDLQHNGIPIATYVWGEGSRTALLLHGWGGRAASLGGFVDPLLARGFKVVSIDMPAHGRSGGKRTNLPEITDVLIMVGKKYGVFDVVVAHSFAGMCIAFALQQGLAAKRAVVIGAPARMEFLLESFTRSLKIPEQVAGALKKKLRQRFGADVIERLSIPATAAALDLPLLIVHDADDRQVPISEGRIYERVWTGARFIQTSGLGHKKILNAPDVIAAVVQFATQAITKP